MDSRNKIRSRKEKFKQDIPKKVWDISGIVVVVNLFHEGESEYLEIIVDAYPYTVNY